MTAEQDAANTALSMLIQQLTNGMIDRETFDDQTEPHWAHVTPAMAHTIRTLADNAGKPVGQPADETPSVPEFTSQLDIAREIRATRFGDGLRFSMQLGYHVWTPEQSIWVQDARGFRVRSEIQRSLGAMVDATTDTKTRNKLGGTAMRNAVNELLATDDGVYLETGVDPWDREPHYLAAPNCVIDLRSGKPTDATPDQYLTKSVAVPYDPDAECPRWEAFLAEVFPNDPDMPAYLQRLIGYGITGETREQCFGILWGSGANGKSVFQTTLRAVLGPHAVTVPFDMFTGDGKNRGGPDAEHLKGARVALASETNRTAILDTASIKNATGGEEINVNPKFRDPFTFTPTALIMLATNYRPLIKEQDNGTWRRIKVIEFSRVFADNEQDKGLESALKDELPGILAWAVRGAAEWYVNGLQDPESVRNAVAAYKQESDALDGFFPGRLDVDPSAKITYPELVQEYREWCESNGERPMSTRALVKALEERDTRITRGKSNGDRIVWGIKRTPPGAAPHPAEDDEWGRRIFEQ